MPDRMWSLAEFRFDEAIEADEVYLDSGTGVELRARDEAISLAHERGANLVAWWPPDGETAPSCIVAKVSLPLRWEQAPVEVPTVDERLWFDAPCGRRDFLVGNGHTFVGRMVAWCPHRQCQACRRLRLRSRRPGSRSWSAGWGVARATRPRRRRRRGWTRRRRVRCARRVAARLESSPAPRVPGWRRSRSRTVRSHISRPRVGVALCRWGATRWSVTWFAGRSSMYPRRAWRSSHRAPQVDQLGPVAGGLRTQSAVTMTTKARHHEHAGVTAITKPDRSVPIVSDAFVLMLSDA
jgi:hypothetical protein